MSIKKDEKLKLLGQLLPEGVAAPLTWLAKEGYSVQLVHKYAQTGWMKRIGRGVYSKPESKVEWIGTVLGIQKLLQLPFHVGGISALNLQGFAHYLPMGNMQSIYIYGNFNPPTWIKDMDLSQKILFMKRPLFGDKGIKLIPSGIRDWTIKISSPERAILEVLYLVEKEGISFQYAAELFEGLSTLRPGVLNDLIAICDSQKVIRLFMFLSNYYNHSWKEYIEVDQKKLGKGKLQIVKNGVFNQEFLITIPKEFSNERLQ